MFWLTVQEGWSLVGEKARRPDLLALWLTELMAQQNFTHLRGSEKRLSSDQK